jgi:hypothetical protein
MKSHLIASLILPFFATLAVACSLPTSPETEAVDGEVGEAESALTSYCLPATCAGNEHPTQYTCDSACGASCSGGLPKNKVTCDSNSGTSFRQCGTGCPSSYHSIQFFQSTGCLPTSPAGGFNQAQCQTDGLTKFYTCDKECPAGYVTSSSVCRAECGSCAVGTNAVWCVKQYEEN